MKCEDCKSHVCEECGNCKCSEWIKCSERLPNVGDCALFYFPMSWDNKPKMITLILYDYKWKQEGKEQCIKMLRTLDLGKSYRIEDCSHWQELPEPPKDN